MRSPLIPLLLTLPLAACAEGGVTGMSSSMGGGEDGSVLQSGDATSFVSSNTQGMPTQHRAATANPPAVSGGTMALSDQGHTLVIADPDRDSVFIVDLDTLSTRFTIALEPGDEPGRIA